MSFSEDLHAHFTELDRRDACPGVVLVRQGTTTIYEGAFGLASRAWEVPSNLETRFDTASIAKLFTAAAVLQMIDALTLDTPVLAYLGPRGTTISAHVTVFHLLTPHLRHL